MAAKSIVPLYRRVLRKRRSA